MQWKDNKQSKQQINKAIRPSEVSFSLSNYEFYRHFLLYNSIKNPNSKSEPLLVGLQISKSKDDLDLKTVLLPGYTLKLVKQDLRSLPGSFSWLVCSGM